MATNGKIRCVPSVTYIKAHIHIWQKLSDFTIWLNSDQMAISNWTRDLTTLRVICSSDKNCPISQFYWNHIKCAQSLNCVKTHLHTGHKLSDFVIHLKSHPMVTLNLTQILTKLRYIYTSNINFLISPFDWNHMKWWNQMCPES